MQSLPKLIGLYASPLIETILPSLMPANTVHPVPQNLHWALLYSILESASARAGSPAIASAAVAADALMKSLLFIPAIASPPDYYNEYIV
jgi:hypothetical protein